MTTRRTRVATAAAAAVATAAGIGLLAPAAGAAAAPSAAARACDRAPWQAAVQGAPSGFGAGSPSGDYLWHDTSGFHLRVTHGTNHDLRVYSGVVTASAPMRIDPVKLEKGDTLKLSASHRSFVFVFANHGYIDGVNFHTDCASTLRVSSLHVGNSNLPASRVDLGHRRQHPSAVPFTLHRASTA